jgi:Domain of Unknown Function with PDB structure (DUF3865)
MNNSALRPTDYASLATTIESVMDSMGGDYSGCVAALLRALPQHFPPLMRARNPVISRLESWSQEQLRFIIQEYSGFSNAAIHMFLEARIRNHWQALSREIVRNMDEEMGVLTRGIPHLELMRHGYREELGIETEGLRYSAVTSDFIHRMTRLFCSGDNTYLAGVLLAFEGTAVEEFRIVETMLRRYKALAGGSINADSMTGLYIAGHVAPDGADQDPEMDHCEGMIDAVGASLVNRSLRPLVQGFLAVCLELSRWWEYVGFEALQETIRDHLVCERSEPSNMYLVLRQA